MQTVLDLFLQVFKYTSLILLLPPQHNRGEWNWGCSQYWKGTFKKVFLSRYGSPLLRIIHKTDFTGTIYVLLLYTAFHVCMYWIPDVVIVLLHQCHFCHFIILRLYLLAAVLINKKKEIKLIYFVNSVGTTYKILFTSIVLGWKSRRWMF